MAAGEAVFLLPFALARVFRPTFLDVFQITNLQLGAAFSVYGIVAVGAYFFGGPLADRFSARRLMTVALLSTAAGGVVLAGVPSPGMMNALSRVRECATCASAPRRGRSPCRSRAPGGRSIRLVSRPAWHGLDHILDGSFELH